jgi:hypothetical protein
MRISNEEGVKRSNTQREVKPEAEEIETSRVK